MARGAKIVRLRGWRFDRGMTVDLEAATWNCGSWFGAEPVRRAFDVHRPLPPRPFVRPAVMIDFVREMGANADFEVSTPFGDFEVSLEEVSKQGGMNYLGGRVAVAAAMPSEPVALGGPRTVGDDSSRVWNDYPSLAVGGKDDEWLVAYQQYSRASGGDRIFIRRKLGGAWQPAREITPTGDHYRTAVAEAKGGDWLVVYAAQVEGNWDLYARTNSDDWKAETRLTSDPQPDIHHHLARDPRGDIWLVWQGFREGQSDIMARRLRDGEWGATTVVSDSPANDWEPSVCAMHDEGVAVAWDTYDAGQYDIHARVLRIGAGEPRMTPIARVTTEPTLEARASVACDGGGRLWIAYDEAGDQWGKDTGFALELGGMPQGSRLYESRDVGLAMLEPMSGAVTRLAPASVSLPLNSTLWEQVEYPHLVVDADDRLWMFFRRRAALQMSARGVGRVFHWELCASCFDPKASRWTAPRVATDSYGRLDSRCAVSVDEERIVAVWPCDLRPLAGGQPDLCHVFAGSLDFGSLEPERDSLAEPTPFFASQDSPRPAPHADERADLARLRGRAIETRGKTYHIYRGDMHRHTETSSDGGGDGSMLDAYRYAIDAASMDFLLVTDHLDGSREYDWWLREKLNDVFRVGQAFTGLFGYERSVSYPNGHRNVFFARRGVRPLTIAANESSRGVNSGEILYPHLRQFEGICFSHTSATGMGTDWRDNDPDLEPLVEIFQGDRTNYEELGAPWSADANDTGTQEGGFQPAGYINLALAKGYKLGFQASSDHLSTHLSYSCVLAERNTRESLMDAMKARHCYAATDNILLDVRADGTDGEHIMGDILDANEPPRLRVEAIGTGRIDNVVVIKDGNVVYTATPDGNSAEFRFTDLKAEAGRQSHYYVRVLQANKQIAWASPIWITYRPSE